MAAASKSVQDLLDVFWRVAICTTDTTKASTVLPPNIYSDIVERHVPRDTSVSESVNTSYEIAKKECEKKVAQIVKECTMINQKYSDPYFNLNLRSYCLQPLKFISDSEDSPSVGTGFNVTTDEGRAGHLIMFTSNDPAKAPKLNPPSVKRVGDIFDDPQFFVDGADAQDVRQGREGDCWFLSALSALCSLESTQQLINKICVARDQDVGVYGFVLYRDGEWTSVIIDDKLYLREPDYEFTDEKTRTSWEENRIRVNSAEEYRKEFQSNSRALYYAQSADPNETWVPLLEKAFAKAHGDYGSIRGGGVGEGLEDLTGGVSTTIIPTDILSKNRFWDESLLRVNQEFLFGCGTADWDDPSNAGRDGIIGSHAYSILRAVNYENERLVLVKNPWGDSEWNGPWSDGSSQWTPESIKTLGHTFGNDGIFWIRYEDLIRKYDTIYKTRLFSPDWQVAQRWTSLPVPWAGSYQETRFEVTLSEGGPTVFVLSKLDERYFRGLTGQYTFGLSFRIHRAGEDDYIMRTFGGGVRWGRSVSSELDLEAGKYEVYVKITAIRDDDAKDIGPVVVSNWLQRREKLLQIGLSYDLAHAKAKPVLESEEKPANMVGGNLLAAERVSNNGGPAESTESAGGKERIKYENGVAPAPSAFLPRIIPNEEEEEEEEGEDDDDDEEEEDDDEGENEGGNSDAPWSAAAVVGLRVYCKDGYARITIVRPKRVVVTTPATTVTATITVPPKLDVDDQASGAANEQEAKEEWETDEGEVNEGEGEKKEEEDGEDEEETLKQELLKLGPFRLKQMHFGRHHHGSK